MDEAWCPVCDRLIPPNKLQIFPDDPSNKPSTSTTFPSTKDAFTTAFAAVDEVTTTTTTTAPAQQPQQPQPQRRPPPPKRAKSKGVQLKRAAGGKKPVAAKLGNIAALNNTANNTDDGHASAAQPPPDAESDAAPTQLPPSRPASSDASNTNNNDNSKFASAASAPTTPAGKTINNSKNNKATKPRTILTQPASLYCSERCRLADEHNYASGSVAGVIYSPSSSYTSTSFVAPPGAGLGVLSSSYPASQSAAGAGPAPAASRNSSRSRTRGGLSRHASATIINPALANASASSSTNPYYLASPLLSPIPSYHKHHSRRQSSYSQNVSDNEDHGAPVTYAYDPDRANGDYFRSLIRGERQGYFTTPATVVPQTPKDGETSSEGSGVPMWDSATGGPNGAGFWTGASAKKQQHTTIDVQSMTNIRNNNDDSSSSPSLLQTSASVSGPAAPAAGRASSSSRSHKSSLPKGGNGTSAPAYIPTNGYLTHFSSLSLNNGASSSGHGHGYGYPFGYPYPDRPPYQQYGLGHGYGFGWGRSSASSSSSQRRQRSCQPSATKGKERDISNGEDPGTAAMTKTPERQRGFFPLRTEAEERLPLFALEPAYPGPLSSTSDSEMSDADEEGGFVMGGRHRRSSDEKDDVRPESMTTAPSTESVQALLAAEAASGSFTKEMAAVGTTPRRPIISRKNTMTADAHSKSSASLGTTIKMGKDASSSKKIRHQRHTSNTGLSSTAPASRGPLSSSPFSSTIAANTSSSSFRRDSKSSINTKARPEHQHGLLVHVPLPRTSSTSHSRSSSLGSTSTALGPLGAAKLAPSVSTIDASGTLVAQPPTSTSGVLPSTIDGLLNNVPVHDVLPPRNDASSRSRSQTHFDSNYGYQVGAVPRFETDVRGIGRRCGDNRCDRKAYGWILPLSCSIRLAQ